VRLNKIDTNKLIADLLAMHDMPLRPDAADKNTLRDAMTVISREKVLAEAIRQISIRANSPDARSSSMDRMLSEIADIAGDVLTKVCA
jgi:hypothetical protein